MIDSCNLYLGDCLEILPTLESGNVDLIYADFVYDDLNFSWIDCCLPLLKENGSIYVQTDFRSIAQLKLYLDDYMVFQNWIVWCYKAHPIQKKRYQRKHDDILFYTKSDNYTWNSPTQPPSILLRKRFITDDKGKITNLTPGMRKRGSNHYIRDVVCRDWWDDIPIPSGFSPWQTGKKIHKWQKPIKLLKRIVLASSNPDDLILDPFMGSGTTGVAAVQTGRRFIGIEILEEYFEIATKRIKEAQLQMRMPI